MKWSHSIRLFTTLLLLTSCQSRWPFGAGSQAAPQPPAAASQGDAAKQGLATFQKLVNETNYRALGLGALADRDRAQLGQPMSIDRIALDALTQYREGSDVNGLLVDGQRSFYPVRVGDTVVSSLYLTKSTDGWRATDFGNAALARALSAQRKAASDFIVLVPALKLYFIARRDGSSLQLTAVVDDERYGLKAGETLPADRAIASLQRAAAKYNGLPQ